MRRRLPRLWLLGLLLAFFVCASASPGLAQTATETSPDETAQDTAPVVIDGHTLYMVRGVSAYPAARRAEIIRGRILELARDPSFDPGTITITESESYVVIGVEGRPALQRVTEADAEFEGSDRAVLADVYRARIREAIANYRAARSSQVLLLSAKRAAIATLLVVFAVFVLYWSLKRLRRWLERRYADRVKTVSIRSFELLRAERIWELVRGALRLAGLVSLILVIVFYLRYTLALFPWTFGTAQQIDDWILGPLAVLGSGFAAKMPDLVFLAVLAIIVRYALRVIHLFFFAIGRGQVEFKDFDPSWAEPTYKLVRIAVIAFAVIVAYPYIPGSSSDAFKGISIFLGVMFSLGSSSTISNVLAGYVMIYRRAFSEGDVVKIAGMMGYVARVRLQVTHLRTAKNEDIIIPNSSILAGEVINYSTLARTDGLILHTTVGIGYETPWRQVEAMLLEAASRTEGLRTDPKPFVLQTALGDFAITYQLNVYCEEPRRMLWLYSALHANILDLFNEYGVQIMTPAYEGDPSEPKIVPRDKWYQAPAAPPPKPQDRP